MAKAGDRMPCDGTIQDYRRHRKRKEPACQESKEAWRRAVRYYRYTGVYEDRDPMKAHPFMYRRPGRKYQKPRG